MKKPAVKKIVKKAVIKASPKKSSLVVKEMERASPPVQKPLGKR